MPGAESVSIAELSARIMEEMVRGEQLLRRLRVRSPLPGRPPTGVWVSPRMRARLQLALTRTATSRFVLGLFGGGSTRDVVANIRLSFELAPAPDGGDEMIPEFSFSILVPPFLRYRVQGGHACIDFLVTRRQWFTGRASPDGGLGIYDQHGQLLSSGASYSTRGLAAILDRTARWLRAGAGGEARRFDLDTQGAVGELMRRIAGYHQQVFGALGKATQGGMAPRPGPGSLEDLPSFDCSYRITDVHAKALLQLDGDGRLVEDSGQKESADWQQLDFVIRPGRGMRGARTGLSIAIRPPDFLVCGDGYHRRFLLALQTREALRILWDALEDAQDGGFAPEKEIFGKFLRNASQSERSLLVRVDARDHDLVLLAGPLGGRDRRLLFLVQFEVTEFPSVAPSVVQARFLAGEIAPGRWVPERVAGAPAALIDRYLTRVFRTALGWLRGVVP